MRVKFFLNYCQSGGTKFSYLFDFMDTDRMSHVTHRATPAKNKLFLSWSFCHVV